MPSFWDDSWKQVNTDRLTQYISEFDLESDNIMEYLLSKNVHTVCDAGCGCGIYSRKLISHGFAVSGFDISIDAVYIARKLLENASVTADLKAASILSTGYEDNQFDAVISRDVIDHMGIKDGIAVIRELYRITKPGGIIFITLDHLDSEYETEPHAVNCDGDYVFTDGKWNGMVFHPYREQEIMQMLPSGAICEVTNTEGEIIVKLIKPVDH